MGEDKKKLQARSENDSKVPAEDNSRHGTKVSVRKKGGIFLPKFCERKQVKRMGNLSLQDKKVK